MLAEYVTQSQLEEALKPLATKEELREAIAPLATKEELKAAIALLATKEDLKSLATKEEIKSLATKEELEKAIASLPTLEQIRHEFNLSVEQFRSDFGFLHDAYKAVNERQKDFEKETNERFDKHEKLIAKIDVEVALLKKPDSDRPRPEEGGADGTGIDLVVRSTGEGAAARSRTGKNRARKGGAASR